MSLLEQIQRGKEPLPPRITLYGQEGVGKSTCGSAAPNAVFIDVEGGLGEIECARFPRVKTIEDVFAALAELRSTPHDFKSVVIDTADALERFIHTAVCKRHGVDNVEKVLGGYGKGYVEAANLFEKILAALDLLRSERRMAVIIIAHAKVEKFYDPEAGEYDRYSPRLHKGACALLKEWSDAVLFATRKMRVERDERDRGSAKPVGRGGGDRILRTEGGPACVAKNRYGMPAEIPLSWDAIFTAIRDARAKAAVPAPVPAAAVPTATAVAEPVN